MWVCRRQTALHGQLMQVMARRGGFREGASGCAREQGPGRTSAWVLALEAQALLSQLWGGRALTRN